MMDRIDGASIATWAEIRAIVRSVTCRRLTTFDAAHGMTSIAHEPVTGTQFVGIVDATVVLARGPGRSFEDATALRAQV